MDRILDWLLEDENPSVKYFTQTYILKLSPQSEDVRVTKKALLDSAPVLEILQRQDPEGWWGDPQNISTPMYRGTTWQLMLLVELGADCSDRRIQKSVDYILEHALSQEGSFPHEGSRWQKHSPMDLICNDGMVAFGILGSGTDQSDERVQRIIDFMTRALLETDYCCRFNQGAVCAWGLVKALRVLSLVPVENRSERTNAAIQRGAEYILNGNLAKADYPHKPGGKTSDQWFRLGWPRSYQADILQTLLVLTNLGFGKDTRLNDAKDFLRTKELADGGWPLEATWNQLPWSYFKASKRQPSKWVSWQVRYILGEK
jgi:hypothetical protein